MLNLKLAQTNDAQLAMSFIDQAKAHLKAQGIDQWQTGYPDLACIEADIALQKGYFLADGETPIGYLCIDFAGEPAYLDLKGEWGSSEAYGVVHRMAIGDTRRGQGLAARTFRLVQQLCLERNVHCIRIDTDGANEKMQHVLAKAGFQYRGTIQFDGSEKIAFDKMF